MKQWIDQPWGHRANLSGPPSPSHPALDVALDLALDVAPESAPRTALQNTIQHTIQLVESSPSLPQNLTPPLLLAQQGGGGSFGIFLLFFIIVITGAVFGCSMPLFAFVTPIRS